MLFSSLLTVLLTFSVLYVFSELYTFISELAVMFVFVVSTVPSYINVTTISSNPFLYQLTLFCLSSALLNVIFAIPFSDV